MFATSGRAQLAYEITGGERGLVRIAAALFSGGEQGSLPERPPRPALRVAEALAGLSGER